ncbi:hypothetical protein D9758_001563 [Tetrapyrgos nigripes]|uniref:Phosducin domain-containing protein n=1 Tax=Tetrapyrgos nigripes TaxID=182062 RepID=A0A8H5GXS3_9AGAR|nr:hypothetical protein D9758_001563 [Tetrapyrgos nigripes]
MAINPNEDTEFNDALRKHGILPQLKTSLSSSPSPPPSPTFSDILNDFSSYELSELNDNIQDDEKERIISAYRRQRLAEEKIAIKKARFGRVYPIGRDDYAREVTEASKVNEEDDEGEQGTGVVCLLFKDGIPRSDRAVEQVRALANRYPRTKFVSIVGHKCIPNLPDSRVPMLIVYKNGEVQDQMVAWGADRKRAAKELEARLLMTGTLQSSEHIGTKRSNRLDECSDDEESESTDSDFEFDL